MIAEQVLTKKDFESDQEVRWCPGCGDYSILATIQRLLPELGVPKEKHVFISGIGCAARFPYYMNTFGFHTIHGRAPAIATGTKLANPDLSVWIISGDGDALSIGGNHLIHLLRRNINVNVLLFNNRIYGLTKGQYSPTSESGKITKSTPQGSIDEPLNPALLALGAGATFVARAIDVDSKHLAETMKAAHEHEGTSFVEIYQNCNVFNDGAYGWIRDREGRNSNALYLEEGQPLTFGSKGEKVLRLENCEPKVSEAGDKSAMVHNPKNRVAAQTLAGLTGTDFPTPLGVLYRETRPSYDKLLGTQIENAKSKKSSLQEKLLKADTWEVR